MHHRRVHNIAYSKCNIFCSGVNIYLDYKKGLQEVQNEIKYYQE